MEKMFVDPESLESRGIAGMSFEDAQSPRSRADIASHRCKLYRTVLEQRNASQQAWLLWNGHDSSTDGAYA
jgi:hypothetical protein